MNKCISDSISFFLEFIRIIIWPSLIFILINIFKIELSGLFSRIQSVSGMGVKIDTSTQQVDNNQDNKKLRELTEELNNQKDIQKKLTELQDATKRDREWYLIHFHLEKTYRLIFGSQLDIINILFRNGPTNSALIKAIYQRTNWSNSYPFNQYIGFLENSSLISYSISNNTYSITPLGSLFFQYLIINNIQIINKQPY